LKADYDPSKTTTLNDYENYGKTTTKVKEMNPNWANSRGTATTWIVNEKAAAWLCDPEDGSNINRLWSSYYDGTKANYVIGGPSIEMYCDSYNRVEHLGVTNYKLGVKYIELSAIGYIYTVNGESPSSIGGNDYWTGTDTVDYKNYGSMYCGKDGAKGNYNWWIASPSSINSNCVCNVYGYAGLYYYGYSDTHGVSPLVSLRSDFTIQIEK
jgi:hypothetical protein